MAADGCSTRVADRNVQHVLERAATRDRFEHLVRPRLLVLTARHSSTA